MDSIISMLKSRGKLGGMGLMLIGIGQLALVFFGKDTTSGYGPGSATFFLGLSLLGIRGALDKPA